MHAQDHVQSWLGPREPRLKVWEQFSLPHEVGRAGEPQRVNTSKRGSSIRT